MRRQGWIVPAVAAWLALAGCSSSETKKEPRAVIKVGPIPDLYRVTFDTSKGPVEIEVHRDWAPHGSDHFYTLVKTGYYDGNRFFRVVRNFVVQFGISGDPKLNQLWANANIPDDPRKQRNVKGTLTYAATSAPNSRATQLFINLVDNKSLDKQGFAPIGTVVSGMDTVERLWDSYGEMAPRGHGPDPTKIEQEGNEYLDNRFPRLDSIRKATIR